MHASPDLAYLFQSQCQSLLYNTTILAHILVTSLPYLNCQLHCHNAVLHCHSAVLAEIQDHAEKGCAQAVLMSGCVCRWQVPCKAWHMKLPWRQPTGLAMSQRALRLLQAQEWVSLLMSILRCVSVIQYTLHIPRESRQRPRSIFLQSACRLRASCCPAKKKNTKKFTSFSQRTSLIAGATQSQSLCVHKTQAVYDMSIYIRYT